jgi:hypothetical protein
MKRILRLTLAALLLMACVHCTLFRKKKPVEREALTEAVVGQVEMVNTEQNFVLIFCPNRTSWQPGTVFTIREGELDVAEVKVTPERQGAYTAADITSGNPQKGQAVVWKAPVGTAPLPSPAATTMQPTGSFSPGASPSAVPSASLTPSASLSPTAP